MATETCAICRSTVPFADSVHVMLHADAVEDHYVCRTCYEERLAPLFASAGADEDASAPGESDGDASPDSGEGASGG